MKKIPVLLLALCALGTAPAAFAQAKPRLAILPFTGGGNGDGETIAELFSFEPEIDRVFTRIPRTGVVETIMREQQFQRSSGLTDSDTIARLGRQLNADFVVAGHIQTLGASKLILITIIQVESLRQIAGDFREYRDIEEVQGMIPAMAGRIARASRLNGANLPRLAVLPFTLPASGVNQGEAEVLAQLLATEMANSGRYAVLPRTSTIQTVMEEHRIQRSGLTDSGSIRVIGRALNAQYVLAGSVRSLGQANMFTAQILNVEDASLVAGSVENYTSISDGLDKMVSLGGKLARAGGASSTPPGFVRVEGGTFLMGSNGGGGDEGPAHNVSVKSFNIAKYEVTQKEWIAVMGNNPSRFKGDNLPVENISWHEAVEYCNRLSVKENLAPAYRGEGSDVTCDWDTDGYRLPTEAEWEYAARGGNKDSLPYEYSGSNSTGSVAWFGGNSGGATHPVGTKSSNSLGIYDMSGNVWEWCGDWKAGYPGSVQTDPRGPPSGSARITRGGSWVSDSSACRITARGSNAPLMRFNALGFRLVRP